MDKCQREDCKNEATEKYVVYDEKTDEAVGKLLMCKPCFENTPYVIDEEGNDNS